MTYGENFVLTLFTNDVVLAKRADEAGINRIGLDLEKIGKAERQAHLPAWISDHEEHELPVVGQALHNALLFARTNPIHPGLQNEIDGLIDNGAQVLMLPMFTTVQDVRTFIELVAGRAKVSLLLETAAAAAQVDEIVRLPGIDEIHIGLNDLYLSLGLSNHFEVLGSELMENLSAAVVGAGIPFGFGGVGRLHDERLPMPSDLVYAQYPRLHADRALVSRVFVSPDYRTLDLKREVALFRARMNEWFNCPQEQLTQAHDALRAKAKSF